jgi:hypothetical protein
MRRFYGGPLFLATLGASAAGAGAQTPIPLGVTLAATLQPLYLSSSTNLTLALGDITKDYATPAVVPEHPWENSIGFYTSSATGEFGDTPPNTSSFRLYYTCMPYLKMNSTQPVTLCMANSTDGIVWTKPLLPFFAWDGATVVPAPPGPLPPTLTPTNAVFQTNDTVSFPGSVFLDSTAPAAERWKLTYEGAGSVRLLYLASSPDGLQWSKRDPDQPIVPVRLFSDTQTALVVTPPATEGGNITWTALGRSDSTYDNDTTACAGAYPSLRRVMAAVSTTGADGPYSTPVEIVGPGSPDTSTCLDDYNPAPIVLHNVTFFLISQFLHFPANISGSPPDPSRINDGIQDVRLAYTLANPPTEGVDFYASRAAFIPRGAGWRDPVGGGYNVSGSDADAGFVFATAGGMIDPDVTSPPPSSLPGWPFPFTSPSAFVHLLYWGSQATHTGGAHANFKECWQGVLRARVRREGLVRLRTPPSDPWGLASFQTAAVSLPDPRTACAAAGDDGLWLLLNAETSVGGYVRVELRDAATGVPVPGYDFNASKPLQGNAVRTPVAWMTAGGGVTSALELPSQHGTVPLILAFEMKHASLYAWDLQCVGAAGRRRG